MKTPSKHTGSPVKYVDGRIGDCYGGPNGVMTLKPRLCVCLCVCVCVCVWV